MLKLPICSCFRRLSLIPLLLSFVTLAFAQGQFIGCSDNVRTIYDFEDYSDSLQRLDFQYALQLTHPDSMYQKAKLLRFIIAYDSLSVVGRQAVYELTGMQRRELEYFFGAFCGKWRWLWTGSNWGTSNSPEDCTCTRYIEVTQDSITYRENDEIVRKAPYRLVINRSYLGLGTYFVEIPGEPCWRIRIDGAINTWFAKRYKSPEATKFLNTSWELGCVCGCREDVYEKIE